MDFQTIQEFYQLGLWDAAQIAQLVTSGILTDEQYKEIVGEAYPVQKTMTPQTTSTGEKANG